MADADNPQPAQQVANAAADRQAIIAAWNQDRRNSVLATFDHENFLDDGVMNGELFAQGMSGERLVEKPWQKVYFSPGLTVTGWFTAKPNGTPDFALPVAAATQNAVEHRFQIWSDTPAPINNKEAVLVEVAMTRKQSIDFCILQILMFCQNNDALAKFAMPTFVAPITHAVPTGDHMRKLAEMAAFRLASLLRGMISPRWLPATHHVHYNDARMMSDDELLACDGIWRGLNAVQRTEIREAIKAACTKWGDWANDVIAMCAYGMRSRGHHYTDDMEQVYTKLWGKVKLTDNADHPEWKITFTAGLHAIFPDVLDEYWRVQVALGKISGAMVKRVNVAAAGTAVWGALYRAMDDVFKAFPKLEKKFEDEANLVNTAMKELTQSRWRGSINRMYYGAQNLSVTEEALSTLASVVRAIYEKLASDSAILQSNSLMRVARNAPLVGKLYGNFANVVSNDPRLAKLAMIIEDVEMEED